MIPGKKSGNNTSKDTVLQVSKLLHWLTRALLFAHILPHQLIFSSHTTFSIVRCSSQFDLPVHGRPSKVRCLLPHGL